MTTATELRPDRGHWQRRLDELRITHRAPGAALAVLSGDRIHEFASGTANAGTDVAVTTDTVFLAGSLAKTYTATAVMALVDRGAFALDDRLVDLVPGFATPDPAATATITVEQVLTHTAGLTCDFTLDTGRGDDCLAAYVEALRQVRLDCPPGTAFSYSSCGYVVLGRLLEVVTGSTWDEALADLVLRPLGLEHTVTLPEEALRFRAAIGHTEQDGSFTPDPQWDPMPRSAGPYGRVIVSAGDVLRFARMHVRGGLADDGTRVLSERSATAMRRRRIDVVDPWSFHADGWGLGWSLADWNGAEVFGHDGSAVTQESFLRVDPASGTGIALLVNGGDAVGLYQDLAADVFDTLAGLSVPPPASRPVDPPEVDIAAFQGTFRREGVELTVARDDDGTGVLTYTLTGGMSGFSPPMRALLTPVSSRPGRTVFVAEGNDLGPHPVPVVFVTVDGTEYAVLGLRMTPRA